LLREVTTTVEQAKHITFQKWYQRTVSPSSGGKDQLCNLQGFVQNENVASVVKKKKKSVKVSILHLAPVAHTQGSI
jgi:hypothetical protein